MIVLTQGQSNERVVVTLEEKRTIAAPFYVFTFTHATTKEQVQISFDNATQNLSSYRYRYDEFSFNTASMFNGKPTGEWLYEVQEVETISNATSDSEIELSNIATEVSFNVTGGSFQVGDMVRVQHNAGNFFDGVVLELLDGGLRTTMTNVNSTAPSFNSWMIVKLNEPVDGNVVEVGKMQLIPATAFEYTQYDAATTYKQYNG